MDVGLMKKWEASASRYDELTSQLMDSSVISQPPLLVKLTKERTELEPISQLFHRYQEILKQLDEAALLLSDASAGAELHSLASDETAQLQSEREELERRVLEHLTPKDPRDEKNLFLEIRAGTGGDEAALFAGDLLRMYQRYAEAQGWRFELISASASDVGGYKEAVASISGPGVFAKLKFESGVHRVQRVPVTESGGRIHTSAATVAVLPEAEDVDVQIDDKDLRIDVYRSSGPGGQSVNTTDSAVRITHLPTGLVVIQQDEKSQHKNKAKALKVLRTRLFEMERERLANERAGARRSMVGSGDRSERIRTYNFPQGRVTDHRINLTLHKLPEILEGPALDEMIGALVAEDEAERLAGLEEA